MLKQMFAKGYAEGDAAPRRRSRSTWSGRGQARTTCNHVLRGAGRGFYEQIEDAIESGDEEPLIDFSQMPKRLAGARTRGRGAAEPRGRAPAGARESRARH